MEFYYNCTLAEKNNINNQIKKENVTISVEHKLGRVLEPIVETVCPNQFSVTEFIFLILGIISVFMNIVQLYCMYIFSKYLDS